MVVPLFRSYALLLFTAVIVTSQGALADKCFEFVEFDYGSNKSRIEVVDGFATNLTLSLNSSGATTADCLPSINFRVKLVYEGRPRSELDNDPDFDRLISLTPNGSARQIEVKGIFVGHSKILFQVSNTSINWSAVSKNLNNLSKIDGNITGDWVTVNELRIATFRMRRPRDDIFQAIVFALIIFGNAGIGLNVNWEEIADVLKRPIGPAIGFCCQYIIMPITAFAAVKLVLLDPTIALGIFIVGCSPGGGGSNYHTYFLGGHLPLSVTMTIISTLAALVMMPFWIYTLGSFLAHDEITIAFQGIGASLASTIFPFGVGIFVRWKQPHLADKMFRFGVRPMLIFVFAYLITAGVLTNLYAFKLLLLEPKIFLAAVILPYTGFALGFVIAYVSRQGWSKSITIAIETGIQSSGVAMATLMLSLRQPDSDIAILGPLATTMLTPIPLWIAEISYGIYLCVKKRRCFIFDGLCRKKGNVNADQGKSNIKKGKEETETGAVTVPLVSSPPGIDNTDNNKLYSNVGGSLVA